MREPIPRQLPATIADFTGRDELAAKVAHLLSTREPLVNLTGMPGAGKSALAVHVAHLVADTSFPDGQLFVTLRGASAHDVIGRFLRALGVPGESVPQAEDQRAEMYQTVLADKAVLVVLDDAASSEQVTPLLPSSPRCSVLVTSRIPIAEANVVQVGVLEQQQALSLLAKQIGEARIHTEPDAAAAIAESTGGLPLALRILGARLAARPHWSLASMVRRLADERSVLDELAHGELAVRGSLQVSYEGLGPDAVQLLGLLSGVDAETVDGWMASAALGRTADDALQELIGAQFLDSRKAFHDLVRAFARERGEPDGQRDAVARVVGGWLYQVDEAHDRWYGGPYATIHGVGARWVAPLRAENPLAWLASSRVNLCLAVGQAAQLGLDELSWDLAVNLVTLFEAHGYYDDWERTHEAALRSTEAAGNTRGSAALRCSLASMHINRQRFDLARPMAEASLAAFEALGDQPGLALAYRNMGIIERRAGARASSRRCYRKALDIFKRLDDIVGIGTVLAYIAQLDLHEGDHWSALTRLGEALAVCETIENPRILAQIKFRLGKVMMDCGERDRAHQVLSEALELTRAGADVQGETFVLQFLALNELHRGKLESAREFFDTVIALCERRFDVLGTAQARIGLARLHYAQGEIIEASQMAGNARAVLTEFGLQVPSDDNLFSQ